MNRALIRKTLFILAIVLAGAFAIFRAPVQLGLDLKGGASLILRVKVDGASPTQQRDVVEQTKQILERRINAFGLSEAPVQPMAVAGMSCWCSFQASDPSRIKGLLQSRAVLEWDSGRRRPPGRTRQTRCRSVEAFFLTTQKLLATRAAADRQRTWYAVDSHPIIQANHDAKRPQRVSRINPLTTFTLWVRCGRAFQARYRRTSETVPRSFSTGRF